MKSFIEWLKDKDPCWDGYKQYGTKKKGSKKVPNCVKENNSFVDWMNLKEEKEKPFKNFNPKKNHPEGGLSRAEAKRQGIHAGIETKEEAERKGGVNKMSEKTKARRKSFCARMKGMKKKLTSKKTANDPNSKINAALRVWKC